MKNTFLLLTSVALLAGFTPGSARAALLDYDLYGTISAPVAASSVNSDVSASSLAIAEFDEGYSGVYPNSIGGGSNAQYFPTISASTQAFTFTVTPTAGTTLDLSDLDLSEAAFVGQNFDAIFTVESSVSGSTALATYDTTANNLSAGSDVALGTNTTYGSDFTDITGPVTFSIYVTASTATGAYQGAFIAGGNGTNPGYLISLNGTATTTPEPGTVALMGLGLGLLMLTLRNRRFGKI